MCVLVVEDEWITLMVLAEAFEDRGYEVMTAEHGQRAFDHLDRHPGRFTCLVTDFHMPGRLTGAHVIERMRPDYPAIPMILTTAVVHAVTADWCACHAVHLVPKPYSLYALVGLVSRLLPN